MALGFSKGDLQSAIKAGDRDGDGQLTFDEFVALVAGPQLQGPENEGALRYARSVPLRLVVPSG